MRRLLKEGKRQEAAGVYVAELGKLGYRIRTAALLPLAKPCPAAGVATAWGRSRGSGAAVAGRPDSCLASGLLRLLSRLRGPRRLSSHILNLCAGMSIG